MKNKLILVALAFLGISFSCKNELIVNEEWSEIPVVFGLLNQTDSVQYIRISKAFLGAQSAYVMAANYDSLNYGNQLDVKINEIANNAIINTFTLIRDTSIVKPAGNFAYPRQVLYKLINHQLDENDEYELVVTNTLSGHIARAKTKLVKDFMITSPYPSQQINMTIPHSIFHVKWLSGKYGKEYNLAIRFWYTETNKITGLVRQRFVDWGFPDVTTASLAGGEGMEMTFNCVGFYTMLRSRPELAPNDSLWRHVGKITNASWDLDFILTAAGDEFATYMDVSSTVNPTFGDHPSYTNITNGVGIFSSRYVNLAPQLYGKPLTPASIDSIYAGQYTYNLGFCSPSVTSPYHCN